MPRIIPAVIAPQYITMADGDGGSRHEGGGGTVHQWAIDTAEERDLKSFGERVTFLRMGSSIGVHPLGRRRGPTRNLLGEEIRYINEDAECAHDGSLRRSITT